MEVKWTRPALTDLLEAQNYIESENPTAAKVIAQRIWQAAQELENYPHIGRVGHIQNTREWVIKHTPYILVYRENNKHIEILHVYHGRQNWRNN